MSLILTNVLCRLPVSYKWKRKDGRPFVKGTKIIDRNRVLIVPDAPLSAEGEYVCSVSCRNGVGSKTITVVMEGKANRINIFVSPYWTLFYRYGWIGRKLIFLSQNLKLDTHST